MKCTTDQLYSVPARSTVQAAYGALDALQHEPPAVQVMAAAVLFRTLAVELKLDVSQLMASAAHITRDDDNPYRTEVAAFRGYIQGELK